MSNQDEARRVLRRTNLATMPKRVVEDSFDSLDGSLKRNTAFIKRLKNITHDQLDMLRQEFHNLRMTKFLSEAATSIIENRPKNALDVLAMVTLSSDFVQRYHGFENMLISRLLTPLKQLCLGATTSSFPVANSTELMTIRIGIRILTEYLLVGILKDPKILHDTLKGCLPEDDLKGPQYMSVAISFAKNFGFYFFEFEAERRTEGGEGVVDRTELLVDKEWVERIKEVILGYFRSMCRLLVRMHGKTKSMKARSKKIYDNYGDLNDTQSQALQTAITVYEGLQMNLQGLSELVHLPLPDLPDEEEYKPSLVEGKIVFADLSIGTSSGSSLGGSNSQLSKLYDSEEDRSFYEDLVPLQERIPEAFLISGRSGDGSSLADKGSIDTANNIDLLTSPKATDKNMMGLEEFEAQFDQATDIDPDVAIKLPVGLSDVDESMTSSTPQKVTTVQSFLTRLGGIHSVALVDQACIDFFYLNSKSLRKNLSEYLIELTRNKIDLIPFVGRFLATIKPYYPEIGDAVVASLMGQYHFLWRNKYPLRGTRSRVCRYIGELTKFRVFPQGMAFTCIKKAVDEFSLYNVDMVCILLESCGRFLYNQPESHRRIEILMDIISKKKRVASITQDQLLMIENALFTVNPPETPLLTSRVVQTPHEEFILKLIRYDLSPSTAEQIFRILRALDWKDVDTREILRSAIVKIWKVKYSVIPLVAAIVNSLQKYHKDFVIEVVDDVLEEIRLGLENNYLKWHQQRLALVKYLGELYVYNVIDANVIFDTLALFLTFGYPKGLIVPEEPNEIDPPSDHFRISLCCILLQVCGEYFIRGSLSEVLEKFLILFQYYICCKDALSSDMEYLVEETFEHHLNRPWMFKSNFDGVVEVLARLIDDGGASISNLIQKDRKVQKEVDALKLESLCHEQEIQEMEQKLNREFESELSGMIAQGLETRKLEKKVPVFDVAIPFGLATREKKTSEKDQMVLSVRLLTKKKHKMRTKEIGIEKQASFNDNEDDDDEMVDSLAENNVETNGTSDGLSDLLKDIQKVQARKRQEALELAQRTLEMQMDARSFESSQGLNMMKREISQGEGKFAGNQSSIDGGNLKRNESSLKKHSPNSTGCKGKMHSFSG